MGSKEYKKCKKCGNKELINSSICSNCGASLNYLRKRYTIVIGTLAAILFVIMAIFAGSRIIILFSNPLPGFGRDTYLSTKKIKQQLKDCKWQENIDNEENLEKYIVSVDKSCPYEAAYIAINDYDIIEKYSQRYIKHLVTNEPHKTDDRGTVTFDMNYRKHIIDGDYYGIVCWNQVNLLYLRTDQSHKEQVLQIIENLGFE